MALISIDIEAERDLTVIRFSGMVGGGSLSRAVMRFYKSEVTNNSLWDFSNCNPAMLDEDAFYQAVDIAKNQMKKRIRRKSAIVAPTDLAFGLARMAKSIGDVMDFPVQNRGLQGGRRSTGLAGRLTTAGNLPAPDQIPASAVDRPSPRRSS